MAATSVTIEIHVNSNGFDRSVRDMLAVAIATAVTPVAQRELNKQIDALNAERRGE